MDDLFRDVESPMGDAGELQAAYERIRQLEAELARVAAENHQLRVEVEVIQRECSTADAMATEIAHERLVLDHRPQSQRRLSFQTLGRSAEPQSLMGASPARPRVFSTARATPGSLDRTNLLSSMIENVPAPAHAHAPAHPSLGSSGYFGDAGSLPQGSLGGCGGFSFESNSGLFASNAQQLRLH